MYAIVEKPDFASSGGVTWARAPVVNVEALFEVAGRARSRGSRTIASTTSLEPPTAISSV
jgi:hypothetical protein